MARRLRLCSVITISGVGFWACGESTDVDPTPTVARIEVESPADTLTSLGETTRLVARVLDDEGVPVAAAVSWSSSDPSVLFVLGDGTVTSVDNGVADVVARAGGATGTVRIVVRQVATAIALEGSDTVFNPGVRTRFRGSVTDALGSPYTLEAVGWSSSDPSVATVEPGLVLPLSAGTTRITLDGGGLSAARDLTVVPLIELEVPAGLAESFQWAMEDTAAANRVVGSSAAVWMPGMGTWRGVLGRSDGARMIRPDMLFYPGSIVKMIKSAVVLSLVDDGVLALDDTIGHWLEPFENPNIPTGIALKHLLGNTSGLYSYASHPNIGDSLFADLNRVWTPRETMERFVLAPEFEPGTAWKSSNTGYVLAGMMAEAATDVPIATLLRERVYDAMGMEHAATAFYEEPTSPVPAGWFGNPGGPLQSAADLMTPAAHTLLWPQPLVGAESLLLFARALFGDYLGATVREEMLTAVPDDGRIPGQVAGGLGVRQYNWFGRTQWGHSGSQGAGSGFVVWDEASGVVVAVLYNQNGASHSGSHFRLVPRLLEIAAEAVGVAVR